MKQTMDIANGFQLEEPRILVPWHISENVLRNLFEGLKLRRVTDGYYVIRCISLGGLSLDLGFHFAPRVGGMLAEFELFQTAVPVEVSFEEFQRHLEAIFGPPTSVSPGTEGFPSHFWRIDDVQISHSVREHFGPAEYLRIEKLVLALISPHKSAYRQL
jgi:hypothetical protein